MHTHSIDPFAMMEIPCTPLYTPASLRALSHVSHPSHLSSSVTPSPLLPGLLLSFSRKRARRCRLSSFFLSSPASVNPVPPLFDADIPAKTICWDAGRNCKASSTLFNLDIQGGATRTCDLDINYLQNRVTPCYVAVTLYGTCNL